jgi:hypothetical protein
MRNSCTNRIIVLPQPILIARSLWYLSSNNLNSEFSKEDTNRIQNTGTDDLILTDRLKVQGSPAILPVIQLRTEI